MSATRWYTGPFGLSIWVRSDASDAIDALKKLHDTLADPRPALNASANIMRRSFAENFRAGGRPNPWKPLASSTRYQKRQDLESVFRLKSNRPRYTRLYQYRSDLKSPRTTRNILILSGKLRDSYATKNADHIETVSKKRLVIGSKHWLAAIHEHGTSPYIIRPRRAKMLRWPTPGGYAYARIVRHPGLVARPTALFQDEDIQRIQEAALAWVENSH